MKLKTIIIRTSIRGDKDETIPNQDYIEIIDNDDLLVATVSDGLGSSKDSLEGAIVACKSVTDIIANFRLTVDNQTLDERIRETWLKEIKLKSDTIEDFKTANSFVAVFKREKKILVGQLGDVMVSLRIDGLFRYLESTSKDFSNETVCLGSNQNEKYQITLFEFGHSFDFLIASDGIGDELQPNKIDKLHDYFKGKFKNIEKSKRNYFLKKEIESFVNKKNNDDKSMVFIWTNKK
jgi:hypothetical protein